ncbi:MAG TPA: N-methyl-L-tryptophan oxidase [Pirellulaceae bacterium]|nr:N-methyl-L-tryptophan oxidase [Pirellulaceae bacterium]
MYDAIVIGTGGVGSAAAFHLARRGAKVLGLDRFPGGHDRGSSHGETRIIRQAYFEHPDYVPLLKRAYELWGELEQEAGENLFHQVGLIQIGPEHGPVVHGVLESAQLHQLAVEKLTAEEIGRRWSAFRIPEGMIGAYESSAGYLRVEACVLAHLESAELYGAEFKSGVAVKRWREDGDGVCVATDQGEFHAAKLVITAGPWAPQILADLGIRLEVRRKHLYWLGTSDTALDQARCPTFLYEMPQGVFYGFPAIDALGVKVAEHSGGAVVGDPLNDPRQLDERDLSRAKEFLAQCMPTVTGPLNRHAVCFYTMSPDEHFLVDLHPQSGRVVFAAGLSGHGFKFTSVLGEALAEMALEGRTSLPVGFLNCGRFIPPPLASPPASGR